MCSVIEDDRQGGDGPGHNAASCDQLHVLTGLDDDPRRPLDRTHPLHAQALGALEHQDDWDLREHAAFWAPMLAAWPRAVGRRPVLDRQSAAAAHLHAHGVTDPAEVATVLTVMTDTIRARGSNSRREHPNLEHGAALLAEPDHGLTLLRRAGGTAVGARAEPGSRAPAGASGPGRTMGPPPLPRVYADLFSEPDWSYVNPLLPSSVVPADENGALERAADYLRDLWHAGDPRVR